MTSRYFNAPRFAADGLAPLESPAFSGTPTAPSPDAEDSSTRLATTAFVKGQGYVTAADSAAAAPVQSVAGRTGNVTLAQGDVAGLGTSSTVQFGKLGINRTPEIDALEAGGAIRATGPTNGFGSGPPCFFADFAGNARYGYLAGASGTPQPVDCYVAGLLAQRLTPNGRMSINGTGTDTRGLEVRHTHNGDYGILGLATAGDFASAILAAVANRAASSAFGFLEARSGGLGGTRQFHLRGDGNGFAAGSWSGGGADYAELLESLDGAALTPGVTVVLAGNKVRPADPTDPPAAVIGVVRPKAWGRGCSVLGNTAWNHWAGKYETDAFGTYLTDQVTLLSWLERSVDPETGVIEIWPHAHWADELPDGVTPPPDCTATIEARRRINPAYSPERPYVPRLERTEWQVIGLLGQIPVLKGQPVGDRWLRLQDLDETTEEWLER